MIIDDDDTFAEVEGTVDDDADAVSDIGDVEVTTADDDDIVICGALRLVHAEGPQKVSANARRWLLRLF